MKSIILGALALALVACGQQASTPSQDQVSEIAVTGEPVASGTFSGLSDHVTTGGVSIYQVDEGYVVVLAEDFSLDGAPDPVLGFGNGSYVETSKFSELRNDTGKQSYRLPARLDTTSFTEVYVWCDQFSVPLGVATIG